MRLTLVAVIALVFTFPQILSTEAYVHTLTPSGVRVKWQGQRKINLAGNISNISGVSADNFFSIVVKGLQRWKAAAQNSIDFDYWQGTDDSVYIPSSDYNQLSSIYFASHSKTAMPSNVIGLTQVYFDTNSGEILETDIVLNDLQYQFTMNPTDTTGYGSQYSTYGSRQVYLGNVVTHELGHAYGLSHSGQLQATMLYMEAPEQARLSCDDIVGIQTTYGVNAGIRGTISGKVMASGSQVVFGANVQAISTERGTVLSSVLSGPDGSFQLEGLEAGSYVIMAEPYLPGSSTLPTFYNNANTNSICSGGPFSRTFLTASDANKPKVVKVSAGSGVDAGSLVVSCQTGGAAVSRQPASESFYTSPVIFNGDGKNFSATGSLGDTSSQYFEMKNIAGKVKLSVLSYSLYSSVNPSIRIFDASGNVVSDQASNNVYSGESGYKNFDSTMTVDLAPGNYKLQVLTSRLGSYLYPNGPQSVDNNPFFLVTGTLDTGVTSEIPNDARCSISENFGDYRSPAGEPVKAAASSEEKKVGFCGTVEKVGSDFSGFNQPPRNPPLGAIAGWFLPWLFMFGVARGMIFVQRKKIPQTV